VKNVIDCIRRDGDAAVRDFSERFDKWTPKSFKLSPEQIQAAIERVPEQTITDIRKVQDNVRRFAEAQKISLRDIEIEIEPGVFLGHTNKPIETVGAYVPSNVLNRIVLPKLTTESVIDTFLAADTHSLLLRI
jgi:histidinol dehydrogenase